LAPHPFGAVPHSTIASAHVAAATHLHAPLTHCSGAAHPPQSSAFPQPSFVEPQKTLSASHVFGTHVSSDVGCTVPAGTQRFVDVSQSSPEGHGHVFCEKSIASTPHAARATNATTTIRVACNRFPQPRDLARSIWK
jgi:hypothetical protein